MAIILYDDTERLGLYPLNATRSTADLRVGILSIKEKWCYYSNKDVFLFTASHLSALYEPIPMGLNHWVDARLLVNDLLAKKILGLKVGECLTHQGLFVAGCCEGILSEKERKGAERDESAESFIWKKKFDLGAESIHGETSHVDWVHRPWHIFELGGKALEDDFKLLTANREGAMLPTGCFIIGDKGIFIEKGAYVLPTTIFNTTSGPIYIGKNSTIMEGCSIRGPFSIGENSTLKMGSRIYGGTSIGPNCVAGGEIKNSSLQAFSNKAHDGYLGDSVVGQWCNLGAGTTNSNVKNTAGAVKLYSYETGEYEQVGLKCGSIIGDYSRTSIQTALNTGSMIGVCCNIFGSGFPPKHVPHFSWGMGLETYHFEKAVVDIGNWMGLKGKKMGTAAYDALKYVFENRADDKMIIV